MILPPTKTSYPHRLLKVHPKGNCHEPLGPGVIIVEGTTEHSVLTAVADKLETVATNRYPLDLSGITVFSVDGDGSLPNFGAFFKALGLKTYAFYDKKTRTPEEKQKFVDSFDVPNETAYAGIEKLLVTETPVNRQWNLLDTLRQSGEQGHLGVPSTRPDDESIRDHMTKALRSNKGNGYAARLIDMCDIAELPVSITRFMDRVYADFPRPAAPPSPPISGEGAAETPRAAAVPPTPQTEPVT